MALVINANAPVSGGVFQIAAATTIQISCDAADLGGASVSLELSTVGDATPNWTPFAVMRGVGSLTVDPKGSGAFYGRAVLTNAKAATPVTVTSGGHV